MVGAVLSHYHVSEKLGSGGMGDVYRARDTRLGREVAIKVLPDEFAQDEARLARFRREAKVLASLNHPNIAGIYGLEQSGSTHYLVLELVEGETLAERISRGPIPVEEALVIAVRIADALEEAHERGIVHRDLKPANIKLTPEDKVKVLDFGLAKAFAEEMPEADSSMSPTITRDATRMAVILGTAAYMSPEQAKGKRVDKRTDIFGFGAVLYEMLTGKKAFAGDDISEILASVIKSDPDWKALPSRVSLRLAQLLRRCLEKNPKKRWRDIGDVRNEIEEALATPPEPVAPNEVKQRRVGRRAVVAAGLLVFGFLTAFATWNLKPPSAKPLMPLAIPLPEGSRFSFRGRRVVAVSRSGSHLAYVAEGQIYVRALDNMEAVPLAGTRRARSPTFSPDGRWIAFYAEGAIRKVAVSGGTPIRLCDARVPFGLSWDVDDTILYGAGPEGIFRVPADGGALEPLIELAEGERAFGPQLLPGGNTLLFTLTSGAWSEGAIVSQSLETGETKVLVQGGNDGRYLPTGHLVYALAETLMAVAFDPRKLTVKGTAVPVIEDVARSRTNTAVAQFGYSDTGTFVFVSDYVDQVQSLMWVDRGGGAEPMTERRGMFQQPRLSPDGKRLAVMRAGGGWGDFGDIWILDLERDTFSRLTTEGASDPRWSPDGQWVAFASRGGLYRKRADFSGEAETLLEGDLDGLPRHEVPFQMGSWSGEGRWLVYGQFARPGNEDIWLHSLDQESEARPLLDSRYSELFGEISPDGRWIAYYSSESGRGEIYVQPFPGGGARHQVSTNGGINAAWSPDGEEIFYRDIDGAVYAVEVEADSDFRSGRPRRLFEVEPGFWPRQWDVSPDGQRFVAIQRTDPGVASDQVNVILNWFDELERLVPTE